VFLLFRSLAIDVDCAVAKKMLLLFYQTLYVMVIELSYQSIFIMCSLFWDAFIEPLSRECNFGETKLKSHGKIDIYNLKI